MGAVSRPRSINASEFCSKSSATIAATAVSTTVSAAVQKQDSDYDDPDNVVIVEKIAKTVHGINLHLIFRRGSCPLQYHFMPHRGGCEGFFNFFVEDG